jgi:hypothetical protein
VGTVFSVVIPPPPAVITSIVNNANGTVTLYFLGGANTTNVIQTATSLASPVTWVDVSTNVADANGNWQFTDNAIDTARFYHSYVRWPHFIKAASTAAPIAGRRANQKPENL